MIVPDAVRLSADVKAKEAKHRCHDVEIAKLLIDAGALIVPSCILAGQHHGAENRLLFSVITRTFKGVCCEM